MSYSANVSATFIIKKEEYPASHLLFVLFILPLLKLNNFQFFCSKGWQQWSHSGKDAFYRSNKSPFGGTVSFIPKSLKNQKGKPHEIDLPLLKYDITNNLGP